MTTRERIEAYARTFPAYMQGNVRDVLRMFYELGAIDAVPLARATGQNFAGDELISEPFIYTIDEILAKLREGRE